MIPDEKQIRELLALTGTGKDPEWTRDLPQGTADAYTRNVLRLALLGLLVHPETSDISVQADIDLDDGLVENAKEVFLQIRNTSLELEK